MSEIAISKEGREDAQHTADSAAATYQQALADRGTAHLNLDRTVVRAPVNGYVTNLTLDVGRQADPFEGRIDVGQEVGAGDVVAVFPIAPA